MLTFKRWEGQNIHLNPKLLYLPNSKEPYPETRHWRQNYNDNKTMIWHHSGIMCIANHKEGFANAQQLT